MSPSIRVEQAERGEADLDIGEDGGVNHTLNNELTSLLPTADQAQGQVGSDQGAILETSRRLLYVSHLFAQFSEVAWQFCLILFLAAFASYKSLILVSTYGLISNGSVCVFGARAGRFVDGEKNDRLFVAQCFIWSENLCVLLASYFCYVLLSKEHTDEQNFADNGNWWAHRLDGIPLDPLSIFLLLGIHVLGATAMVLDRAFLVAMERDWVVVMSQYAVSSTEKGAGFAIKDWLSETNVAMKQIDLSCKVAAPAIAGFLLSAFNDETDARHHGGNLRGAAIVVGAINAAALAVEYICTERIYRLLPALAIKTMQHRSTSRQEKTDQEGKSTVDRALWRFLPKSLRVYLDQQVSMAGVSLSLLYLNVLTFGGIMTAYLVWRGMSLSSIGVWRGLSSAVGLTGTFVYHFSVRRLSLIDTGLWSIIFQFSVLSLTYASLYVKYYMTSMVLLILGVCCSRIGLWVFDISVTQLMQEYVPEGVRGVVGGCQQSLNSFFFLLSFGLGIVFPDPEDFHIYVSAGYTSVGLAMFLYAFMVYRKRDSLVLQV